MDALKTIFTRRSVRKYNPGPISSEQVKNILKAAMSAPSAGNSQPWHFIVVDEPEKMIKMAGTHPYAAMAKQAPLGILVCADPGLERYPGFWPQDCSAAVQNILLAAHAMGLGAVWTGIYPHLAPEPFRELFSLPENIIPMAFVVIGQSSDEPADPERYAPERVHCNKW